VPTTQVYAVQHIGADVVLGQHHPCLLGTLSLSFFSFLNLRAFCGSCCSPRICLFFSQAFLMCLIPVTWSLRLLRSQLQTRQLSPYSCGRSHLGSPSPCPGRRESILARPRSQCFHCCTRHFHDALHLHIHALVRDHLTVLPHGV